MHCSLQQLTWPLGNRCQSGGGAVGFTLIGCQACLPWVLAWLFYRHLLLCPHQVGWCQYCFIFGRLSKSCTLDA